MRRIVLAVLCLACCVGWNSICAPLARGDTKPSVTVFPVAASPRPFPDDLAERVGRVIATFLEKAGLEELSMADTAFLPPETDDVQEIATAFGKHLGEHPIQTDCAVFVQFIGTPGEGVKAIRTVVVDRTGKMQLAESAGDAEFRKAPVRPENPMTCCVFVSQRLQQFWQLDDPLRADAPAGRMAEFWRKDAGIPTQEELDAIEGRRATWKSNLPTATLTIYPVRVGGKSGTQDAASLSAILNEHGMGKSEVAAIDPALQIEGHSNQQKVLWDTARAFHDFVRLHPPTTDYALYADYALYGDNVRYVHVIVCDKMGDWVLIDFQNSHHADFQQIDPHAAADCHRLVLSRLQNRLRD